MAAWALRVALSAQRDVAAIRAWTRRQFGARQAQAYARTLSLAIQALSEGPDVAGAGTRDDLAPGVRVLHVARRGRHGRHFVVFRVSGERCIDVLRMLHDSMDLARHLEP
ncbi:MAG: type II toxin-antitoxin system RelE/ParE family toxin [Proteobacteria bacterium]|nr:type II toxin-antitoxin system RelE/ParE family toxin [Pseudomonadota bacterium]